MKECVSYMPVGSFRLVRSFGEMTIVVVVVIQYVYQPLLLADDAYPRISNTIVMVCHLNNKTLRTRSSRIGKL